MSGASIDPIAPRPAATVMLVRDRAAVGIEVFLLRRNPNSDFVGGAYVFPGGALDRIDSMAALEAVCDGRTDTDASRILGMAGGGLAYWVAAVRECFEEAGVLLASSDERVQDRRVLSLADPASAARFAEYRRQIYAKQLGLIELCHRERLRLDVGRIRYFSHWITPNGAPRRYDTRFFVAAAPPEQVPLHDDGETIASLWLTPTEALARFADGDLELILPTQMSLETISRFASAAELLDAAAAIEAPQDGSPRFVADREGTRIRLPGDPDPREAGHPEPGEAGHPGLGEAGHPGVGDAVAVD